MISKDKNAINCLAASVQHVWRQLLDAARTISMRNRAKKCALSSKLDASPGERMRFGRKISSLVGGRWHLNEFCIVCSWREAKMSNASGARQWRTQVFFRLFDSAKRTQRTAFIKLFGVRGTAQLTRSGHETEIEKPTK